MTIRRSPAPRSPAARSSAGRSPAGRSSASRSVAGASEPGHFTNQSMIRRVMRERALALSGPRALLMQAAHPLAVAGLLAHSDALEDPYIRLGRTAQVMNTITFGSREESDRMTAKVRAMHRSVRGRLPEAVGIFPAGTMYRADDPRLLMWILYSLIDSSIVVYRTYVGRLSAAERAALWEDYKLLGHQFGLHPTEMPETLADLEEYGREMLSGDELHVGAWARRRAREIVLEPPVPNLARPLLETVNFITIALLPDRIRSEYRFTPLPPAAVGKALVRAGAVYVRRGLLPLLPANIRQVPAARRAA
jgi:uncharacterized protein (DUF2236 family)